MITLDPQGLSAWERFALGTEEAPADDALIRSWRRSTLAGVPLEGPPAIDPFVGRHELVERQSALERMRSLAQTVIAELVSTLDQTGYVGVLADADGVIVDGYGGGTFLARAERAQLTMGARWGEGARGTNAIGTALAEASPVAVVGPGHLNAANHGLVCYASPILSPVGRIGGLIDLTASVEAASDFARGLAPTLARRIEEAWRVDALERSLDGGLARLVASLEVARQAAALVDVGGRIRLSNPSLKSLVGQRESVRSLAGVDWSAIVAAKGAPVESTPDSPLRGRRISVHPITDSSLDGWLGAVLFVERARLPHAAVVRRRPSSSPPPRPPPMSARPGEDPKRDGHTDEEAFGALDGSDAMLRQTISRACCLAPTDIPLLVVAETGTGKDVLAQAIHRHSRRASGPWLALNCGAFTESLLQSELFGYAGGAFTGASRSGRAGFVEVADGGTLFLDEVADLPTSAQAALLRFLEDGTYFRVGDTTERRADVRLLSATSRNLEAEVDAGRFREDLFFRLRGAKLTLPPLRERDDLPTLVDTMRARAAAQQGVADRGLDPSAQAALLAYAWPGNFRELSQSLAVAVAVAGDRPITLEALPDHVAQAWPGPIPETRSAPSSLDEALEQTGGNVSAAAKLLGVARSTLYRRLRRRDGG